MIWYYDIIVILRIKYFNEISDKAQLSCTARYCIEPLKNRYIVIIHNYFKPHIHFKNITSLI